MWNSASTDARLKKRIARTLIQEVIADLDRDQGRLILVVHWRGGIHTELRLPHRRRGQNGAQTSKDVVEAVTILARVCSDELIAGILTRSGLRTGRGNRWTKERVTSLRTYNEIPRYTAERRQAEGWMNLTQAADLSRIPKLAELFCPNQLDCNWLKETEEGQNSAATNYLALG